jgi:hypothetical protein
VNGKGRVEVLGMNLGLNGVSELGSEVLVRSVSSLELLVGVKSFNQNPGGNTQDIMTSIFNPSILSSVWLAFALFNASRLHLTLSAQDLITESLEAISGISRLAI